MSSGPYGTGLHGLWQTQYPNGEQIGDNAANIRSPSLRVQSPLTWRPWPAKAAAFVLHLSGHHDHPACNGKYKYGGMANGKPQWVKEGGFWRRRSSGRAGRGTVSGVAGPPRRR